MYLNMLTHLVSQSPDDLSEEFETKFLQLYLNRRANSKVKEIAETMEQITTTN